MEIPYWPAARPPVTADRSLFERLFEQLQPQVSELCFAGIYLFRHAHGYRVSRIGESVVVSGHGYDGSRYVLPPLGGDIGPALDRLFSEGLALYGADDRFMQRHLQQRPLNITTDRDNADYLYLRSDLALLPGKRYHKKRNRIAYLTARHTCLVKPYQPEHQQACRTLLTELAQQYRAGSRAAELAAGAEALELTEELGLQGIVASVDGVVRGFALGERLNKRTAVCHFEKSAPYLEGLPQLLNREFAARLFIECHYVNREQDLGEAGLRQAKSSYHPTGLVIKYRARTSGSSPSG